MTQPKVVLEDDDEFEDFPAQDTWEDDDTTVDFAAYSKRNLPKMNHSRLGSKLQTVQRQITTNRKKSSRPKLNEEQALYLCVLQAVSLPVLDATIQIKKYIPSTLDMPISKNIARGETIYLCQDSMQSIKSKLVETINIMRTIQTIDAKIFTTAAQRANMEIFNSIPKMSDIIAILDHYCYIAADEIRKFNIAANMVESTIFNTVNSFVAIIKTILQNSEQSSYEVRNHQYFQLQGYKSLVMKYSPKSTDNISGLEDMCEGVRNLFGTPEHEHKRMLKNIKLDYTEGSVVREMKNYIDMLNAGQFPGWDRYSFPSEEAHKLGIEKEINRTLGLINVFGLRYPSALAMSSRCNYNTNMPKDLKTAEKYFKILIDICLGNNIEETGGVQLNKIYKSILNECALRWRFSAEYKEIAIFESIARRFSKKTISLQELSSYFKGIQKLSQEQKFLKISEVSKLVGIYQTLRLDLAKQMEQFVEMVYLKRFTPEECELLLDICISLIKSMNSDPLCVEYRIGTLPPSLIEDQIAEYITLSLVSRVSYVTDKVKNALSSAGQLPIRITNLVSNFTQDLKKYRAYYNRPLVEFRYIHMLASEIYLGTLSSECDQLEFLDPETEIFAINELYEALEEFYDLCVELNVDPQKVNAIKRSFKPLIEYYLSKADEKWIEWVKTSYMYDKEKGFSFVSSPNNLNSASVVDMFSAFNGGLAFLSKFKFDTDAEKQRLKRKFVKFIVKLNNILKAQKEFEKLIIALDSYNMEISGNSQVVEPSKTSKLFNVKINHATNLGNQNFSSPNPYVDCVLGGGVVKSTPVVEKHNNPVWNYEFTFELGNEMHTDSRAFLYLRVMHDNPLGTDVTCSSCAIFLRDEKIANYLSYNYLLSLRPQGALSVRIRKIGEVDDIAWHIQRAEELIKFTIEDMLNTICSKIIRVIRNVCDQILAQTKGTSFLYFSVTEGKQVSDDLVEDYIVDLLKYLDANFAIINQFSERKYDNYLKNLYPHLGSLPDHSLEFVDVVLPAVPTLVDRHRKPKRQNSKSRIDEHQIHDKPDSLKTPAIFRIIWHEILLYLNSVVSGFTAQMKEDEKRKAQILESILEFLKSIFHCKFGKIVSGLSIASLETNLYSKVRNGFAKVK
ncbi:hypothetical protein HDV01_007010 [Terramyces sp. JEL0728]|nr:hypothetical protein HDV01_007010 [Terramyces sp. JEL0728]